MGITVHHFRTPLKESFFVSNAHVILLSVSPSAAIPLLCEAYKRGLTWPEYAWILHSYRLDDLLRCSTSNKGCRVRTTLEGIFIFQLTKEPEGGSFDLGATHHKFSGVEYNPYSYLLYESVQALISSADARPVSDFNKAPSLFHSKSGDSTVYVYHHLNSSSNLIGAYDGISHSLPNTSEIILFTDYNLPFVNREAILGPYLLPLPIMSFIFNTILLVLCIIFRNEPSVKSTSVSFSMLILTGCYILAGYTVILMVVEPFPLDFCMLRIWFGGTGLSLPLIIATILVKMLRVYRIFTAYKILKRSTHLSDFALLVYTILILSPNIILLILWTAIDPRYRVDNFIEHPGYIENVITCHPSDYELKWFVLGFVYLFLLSVAVIVVAINIRLTQFKDTKKVNILIYLLYIIGIFMFTFWKIFVDLGLALHSLVILYIGHLLMAFLCQIILFVPKIWPAVQKKIIHRT